MVLDYLLCQIVWVGKTYQVIDIHIWVDHCVEQDHVVEEQEKDVFQKKIVSGEELVGECLKANHKQGKLMVLLQDNFYEFCSLCHCGQTYDVESSYIVKA